MRAGPSVYRSRPATHDLVRARTGKVERERVFVTENGWVTVTGDAEAPAMGNVSADRIDRIEESDGLYYDTAVLSEEVGARHVDGQGHLLQEPDLVRRMVTEVEIY